jgi:hypothetical protein
MAVGPIRAALAAGVFLLALGAREARPHTEPAAALGPRPDALEYVAGAQAIVQDGRYFLQVGSERVRPRYPPGFSLLLAPALAIGVPPESLWRVSGLFGAALAVVVGVLAAGAVRRLRPGHPAAELGAFAVAGTLWALAPAAVAVGRAVLSDEPATLFLLIALGLALRAAQAPSLAVAAFAGASWAMTLAIRPVVALPAALVLGPLGVAWWRGTAGTEAGRYTEPRGLTGTEADASTPSMRVAAGLRAGRSRSGMRPILGAVLGVLVVSGLVVGLLLHSGLPIWPWDGYAFWVPERYDTLGGLWSLDYALRGDPLAPRSASDGIIGNLEYVVRSAFGLPGLPLHGSAGPVWPGVGLVLIAGLGLRRKARQRLEAGVPGLWVALALWLAFQLAFYSGYFFAAARFLLPVFALAAAAVGAGLGLLATRAGRSPRLFAAGFALLLFVSTGRLTTRLEPQTPRRLDVPTAERVEAWLALADAERATRPVPFDPVHAQALGFLPPSRLSTVRTWGHLPETVHVRRLRSRPVAQPTSTSDSSNSGAPPAEASSSASR